MEYGVQRPVGSVADLTGCMFVCLTLHETNIGQFSHYTCSSFCFFWLYISFATDWGDLFSSVNSYLFAGIKAHRWYFQLLRNDLFVIIERNVYVSIQRGPSYIYNRTNMFFFRFELKIHHNVYGCVPFKSQYYKNRVSVMNIQYI